MREYTRIPVPIRFWPKVTIQEDGCWVWTGGKLHFGYGAFVLPSKKTVRAHRVAWELKRGPIPAGLHVLHKCDVPACVNPDHLFIGTQAQNLEDAQAKGRRPCGNKQKRKSRRTSNAQS